MDRHRLAYLIKQLRSHQISRAERAELEAYWHVAENDRTRFDRLTSDEKLLARNAIYDGIKRRIRTAEDGSGSMRTRRMVPASQWFLRIAASVAVLVALAFLWSKMKSPAVLELRTGYGEQKTVTLPDKSTVVLNGNSALRFSSSWSAAVVREVWVEGEAYFQVTHTLDNKEFIVHTKNDMDVQVLGTRFNVKAREGKAQVMLQEGSVRLEVENGETTETMLMVPGELATLHNETLSKTTVKPEEYVSWTENKLLFNQTTLGEVAAILKDTYGMTVIFEDASLRGRTLSGEISVDDVDDILKAIHASMGIGITREDKRVTFHGRN